MQNKELKKKRRALLNSARHIPWREIVDAHNIRGIDYFPLFPDSIAVYLRSLQLCLYEMNRRCRFRPIWDNSVPQIALEFLAVTITVRSIQEHAEKVLSPAEIEATPLLMRHVVPEPEVLDFYCDHCPEYLSLFAKPNVIPFPVPDADAQAEQSPEENRPQAPEWLEATLDNPRWFLGQETALGQLLEEQATFQKKQIHVWAAIGPDVPMVTICNAFEKAYERNPRSLPERIEANAKRPTCMVCRRLAKTHKIGMLA